MMYYNIQWKYRPTSFDSLYVEDLTINLSDFKFFCGKVSNMNSPFKRFYFLTMVNKFFLTVNIFPPLSNSSFYVLFK